MKIIEKTEHSKQTRKITKSFRIYRYPAFKTRKMPEINGFMV